MAPPCGQCFCAFPKQFRARCQIPYEGSDLLHRVQRFSPLQTGTDVAELTQGHLEDWPDFPLTLQVVGAAFIPSLLNSQGTVKGITPYLSFLYDPSAPSCNKALKVEDQGRRKEKKKKKKTSRRRRKRCLRSLVIFLLLYLHSINLLNYVSYSASRRLL